MEINLVDQYYLSAQNYINAPEDLPIEWDKACEALNKAISYDPNHCATLCLLGFVYVEHLLEPKKAFACFDRVIAIDPNYTLVYELYAEYLVLDNRLEKAKKLIRFAMDIKGISVSKLYWNKAMIEERNMEYEKSLFNIKMSITHCFDNEFISFLKCEKDRVKTKIALISVHRNDEKLPSSVLGKKRSSIMNNKKNITK